MQHSLLSFLRCPVGRLPLRLQILSNPTDGPDSEIESGILFSPNGFIYPIIDGIPRLLVEAVEIYGDFFRVHLPDYQNIRTKITKDFGVVLKFAKEKNQRTRNSFGFEWSLLNYEDDKIWHENRAEMLQTFFNESDFKPEELKNKLVLDAGCGHGLLSMAIAEAGAEMVIGIDLGQSVDRAFRHNRNPNVHFVQGDLMFPPFENSQFDLVHSSGVIHHTLNTELSFSILHELVKPAGRFCIWLYHPIPTLHHRFFTTLRPISSRLPVRWQYALYHVFIFPWAYLLQRLRGKNPNRRELMIDLMDALSCEYRWEHDPSEAVSWYAKRGYENCKLTTKNWFGFSIIGDKK